MGLKSALKRPWLGGRIFWGLPCRKPQVALTFDDGPHPEFTPRVLDILAAHGAKGTFFCVGKAARAYPDLVKRIVAEGHTLATHTDTHANLAKIGPRKQIEELRKSRETLEELGGAPVRFLRPPWGKLGLTTIPICLSQKLRIALWNFDSYDYRHLTAEKLVARVRKQQPGPGAVALFHDDASNTPDALPEIIAALKERNLECVSLDTLAGTR